MQSLFVLALLTATNLAAPLDIEYVSVIKSGQVMEKRTDPSIVLHDVTPAVTAETAQTESKVDVESSPAVSGSTKQG
ncbi:hypothetical protein BDV95DRAFT_606591 [Massariosphaeria phaeospora]|uniref:Uncharacterized protein n=1 Tax=Massariosphaeria phaeospora TaxID=100035 RepID=A0A7C8IFX0_9PLEO|nr:hypothetical protein BDV95DRAFT_606591 [Massariosphaeria phaeospora]